MLADVVPIRNLNRSFTYRVPLHLQQILKVGSYVLVPLGRTTVQGIIIEMGKPHTASFLKQPIQSMRLKEILDFVPSYTESSLDLSLVNVARYVSDYYVAPLGLCLRLVGPSQGVDRTSITRRLKLTDKGKRFREMSRLSPPLLEILSRLEHAQKGLTVNTLKRHIKTVEQYLPQLSRRGLVQEEQMVRIHGSPSSSSVEAKIEKMVPYTTPLFHHGKKSATGIAEQQQVVTDSYQPEEVFPFLYGLKQALKGHQHREVLCYSSDRFVLSCLLHAVHAAYESQRAVMLITGDVEHATILAEWANQYWPDQVALIHSGLSQTIRRQRTVRVAEGTMRILVGTRSAVFAQVPNLGLISVVHEESSSLKDDQCPYYHVREVARVRAKAHSAVLLLTTASPTVETFRAFSDSNDSNVHNPTLSFPHIHLVDLRQTSFGTVLSAHLLSGIQQAIEQDERVVIFLNRKGFSRALSCQVCGATPHCLQCHIPLTMYKTPPQLVCSYCNDAQQLPLTCPSCLMPQLHPVGIGTEQVEEHIRHQFPHVPIARMDSDVTTTSSHVHRLCDQFRQKEIKILVGTQLLFQAISLPPVRFVGIPNADTGLHIPDFRAAERVFHHLSKAIALAEPESQGGRVVLQTYLPMHHVIRALVKKNPKCFYDQELVFRETLAYPPFSTLLVLQVTGKIEKEVQAGIQMWAKHIRGRIEGLCTREGKPFLDGSDLVLGPIPSRSRYRTRAYCYKLLIKATHVDRIRNIVRESLEEIERNTKLKKIQFRVKVDPLEV